MRRQKMEWMHEPFLHAVGATSYRWRCNSLTYAQELWRAWHAVPWPSWLVSIRPDKVGYGFLITTDVPLVRLDENQDEPRLMESFRRGRWIQIWAPNVSASAATAVHEWIVPEGMHSAADNHSTLVAVIQTLPADRLPRLALALFEETHLRVV